MIRQSLSFAFDATTPSALIVLNTIIYKSLPASGSSVLRLRKAKLPHKGGARRSSSSKQGMTYLSSAWTKESSKAGLVTLEREESISGQSGSLHAEPAQHFSERDEPNTPSTYTAQASAMGRSNERDSLVISFILIIALCVCLLNAIMSSLGSFNCSSQGMSSKVYVLPRLTTPIAVQE